VLSRFSRARASVYKLLPPVQVVQSITPLGQHVSGFLLNEAVVDPTAACRIPIEFKTEIVRLTQNKFFAVPVVQCHFGK